MTPFGSCAGLPRAHPWHCLRSLQVGGRRRLIWSRIFGIRISPKAISTRSKMSSRSHLVNPQGSAASEPRHVAACRGGPYYAGWGPNEPVIPMSIGGMCHPGTSAGSSRGPRAPFVGAVSGGWGSYGPYDPNDYLPIYDVVTNDGYYGAGDVVEINATQEVTLSHGFHADEGSDVHVIIVPKGP